MTVKVTCWPGTAPAVLAAWVILSPGTSTLTVTVHRGSADPAGQLLPGADVMKVLVSALLPL